MTVVSGFFFDDDARTSEFIPDVEKDADDIRVLLSVHLSVSNMEGCAGPETSSCLSLKDPGGGGSSRLSHISSELSPTVLIVGFNASAKSWILSVPYSMNIETRSPHEHMNIAHG